MTVFLDIELKREIVLIGNLRPPPGVKNIPMGKIMVC